MALQRATHERSFHTTLHSHVMSIDQGRIRCSPEEHKNSKDYTVLLSLAQHTWVALFVPFFLLQKNDFGGMHSVRQEPGLGENQ